MAAKEKIEKKVVELADFIAYQEGSVVSREIVSKAAGSVTLFAFDAGQGLSEHSAPFDALVYIVDGTVEIVISGEKYVLQAGEMILMPAHEPHALKAVKKFKMMLTMLKSS